MGAVVYTNSPKLKPRNSFLPFLGLLVAMFFLTWLSSQPARKPIIPSLSSCHSIDQLTIGRWKERDKMYSDPRDFLRGQEMPAMMECAGPESRLAEVASYVFVPYEEERGRCPRWEWNATEAITKALLRMPNGMFVVGDSLGEQVMASLRSLLGLGILIEQSGRNAALSKGKPVTAWKLQTLIPSSDLYKSLLQSGEFTEERLRRPLVTFIRSHHLASNNDLRKWIAGGSNNPHLVDEISRIGYSYGSDTNWLDFISRSLVLHQNHGQTRGTASSRPTVVLISSGPHWSDRHFSNLHQHEADEMLQAGYEAMIQHTLANIPSNPDLHLIVQGSNPVRDSCSQSPQSPSFLDTLTYKHPQAPTRYNYYMFPLFDKMWKSAIKKYTGRARVEFFDQARMMAPRTDAAKSPDKGDCLHFCIPALYEKTRILFSYMLRLDPE